MQGELQKKHLLTDCFSSFDVRTSELQVNALYNNKERERKKHFKKSWKEIDEKCMELYFTDFCCSFVVNEIHC